MKKILSLLLCAVLLTGCGSNTVVKVAPEPKPLTAPEAGFLDHVSRFDSETAITLSDEGITVNGGGETEAVFTSHDIIYYEDRDAYDSGNPYGEGEDWERHTSEEAAAHTVVNITAPGAYRLTGSLSAGQIRIDLGEDAYEAPEAVVELILDGADITCAVAPAILFLNTYECDGMWAVDTAKAEVDTSAAGANLILEGTNTVNGSHVARIYKDAEGEKKLWKQDGAIYSYMSMNVWGSGFLDLTADNEGLDTELHLTVNGGNITIRSGNDGINTNEDGVSVTTINGGRLWITAGLGAEGDGIDSNGYLVINGGIVAASANPGADAGMDSDMGSYINGGTVIALGSTMDWAESDSKQVTMNLQFARSQSAQPIVITRRDGTVVYAFVPDEDMNRSFTGAILSSPNFAQGEIYSVYTGGSLTGSTGSGIVDVTAVTGFTGGTRMAYTGSDVGMGGPGGGRPGGMGEMPEGFAPGQMGGWGKRSDREDMTPPDGFRGEMPEDMTFPEGERPELPEGETFPEGEMPPHPGNGWFDAQSGEAGTEFFMNDMVNCFSGITAAA